MDIYLTFGVALALFILYVSGRTFYKVGFDVRKYKAAWEKSEGKSKILLSHLRLYVVIMGITYGVMYAGGAFAGEWFKGGSAYIGIQSSSYQSAFCLDGGKEHSNFTWNPNIWRERKGDLQFVVGGNFTHHSCTDRPDSGIGGGNVIGPFIGVIY